MHKEPGTSNVQNISETKLLNDLFEKGLYGGCFSVENDDFSISEESEEEYLNPPTPPQRFDSLAEEVSLSNVENPGKQSNSNWFANGAENTGDVKKSNWKAKLNDVLKKVPESARNIRAGLQREKFLARPSLNSRTNFDYRGILFRISSKSVEDLFGEVHYRWLTITSNGLSFYTDNTCDNLKENIPLDSILSLQFSQEKYKNKYVKFKFLLFFFL